MRRISVHWVMVRIWAACRSARVVAMICGAFRFAGVVAMVWAAFFFAGLAARVWVAHKVPLLGRRPLFGLPMAFAKQETSDA